MNSLKLLSDIPTTEFDYNILKHTLRDFKHPRVKINQLLADGLITRVKKGIYIKAEGGFSKPVLANMIYGPSYVSQDYALSLYGLIPEEVTTVTSMTLGRNKRFETPVGVYTYEHLSPDFYSLGLTYHPIDLQRGFIVASPEKALVDRMTRVKGITTVDAMLKYLEHDMRFNFSNFKSSSRAKLHKLAKAYDKPIIWLLDQALQKQVETI